MSKITLLENSLINKIAAGEVVERPSSVVKELVENSIDAGATNVTVEISEGGLSLIRVTDNGSGVPQEDIKTAFLRHATSKIANLNDLENVLTLGFRGEALSSICAVSQLEMITKTQSQNMGMHIEVHGGKIISEQCIASTSGTTVIVGNLFYNTPARRKFLKKPAVESGYISDILQKIALGRPDVAIKYINNSSVILQTNGNNDLKTVIYHIYGKDVTQKMLEVGLSSEGIVISGLTGRPEACRANRTYQSFFINGRYIKSQLIQEAVEEAYKTRLLTGKFPVCVLKLNIEPTSVDVNVHPTKLEVRFSDEERIYKLVLDAVSKALNSEVLIPSVKTEAAKPKGIESDWAAAARVEREKYTPIRLEEKTVERTYEDIPKIAEKPQITTPPPEEKKKEKFFANYKIVGQVFGTYWIIEQNESLYMIDQHAAHERALYEALNKKLREGGVVSQRLVAPEMVKLNQAEKEVLLSNLELIKSFGFEISEEFEEGGFFIKSVPYVFNKPSNAVFFTEIIDKLKYVSTQITDIYEAKQDIIAEVSCKAAVKANDRLSYQEARELIEKILKLDNPFTCPHGRPTIIELSKYEIEKIFKRKGII